MGMPGFRRPLDGEDEVHEFSRPPRDFEQTGDGGYRFTIEPSDLRPPLTEWLEEEGTVTVDYHTDVEEASKARFRLDTVEANRTADPDWTERPVRVRLDPA